MERSEGFIPPSMAQMSLGATFDPSVHGTTGPISISYPQPYTATEAFGDYISAMLSVFSTSPSAFSTNVTEATYTPLKQILDLCTGAPLGAARFFYSLLPGTGRVAGGNRRTSSAWGYVYPFLPEPEIKGGLVVLSGHQATGIVWNSDGAPGDLVKATGVKLVAILASTANVSEATVADEVTVAVSGEVIVSAGAIGVSPLSLVALRSTLIALLASISEPSFLGAQRNRQQNVGYHASVLWRFLILLPSRILEKYGIPVMVRGAPQSRASRCHRLNYLVFLGRSTFSGHKPSRPAFNAPVLCHRADIAKLNEQYSQ